MIVLLAGLCAASVNAQADAVPVQLRQTDEGWQLLRAGVPYTIKGAGGDQHLEQLAEAGGNSIRTWGVGPGTQALLDRAHRLGLTVTLGIWLGHERHGFDYNDLDQVAEQFARVRDAVETYKDHPALLAWGVGNEMEGFEAGDNPAIWSHVEACAALIKRLDPDHPTMTVIAEIGGRKLEAIHKLCPSVDIVGVNSYGGGPSLPERYQKAGATKPYIVTEFGPPGAWEVKPNAFGAAIEPTSTEKADLYRRAYEAFRNDAPMCLGSYAFLWGAKVEATTTWFGMFLADGSRLAAVDAMTKAWSGQAPGDLCPQIKTLAVSGPYDQEPGAKVTVTLDAIDPEGKPLDVRWTLMRDPMSYATGGDKVDAPPAFPDLIESSDEQGCTLTLPDTGGVYRVYVVVKDPAGNAAVANLPLSAGPDPDAKHPNDRAAAITPGKRLALPLAVYAEGGQVVPWTPAGYMGNTAEIKVDLGHVKNPKNGVSCIKLSYQAEDEWAGVVWQDPINDWGDQQGGYDLSGATALEFWARGEDGGEVVTFGFGLLGPDKKYPDSGKGELKEVRLTKDWRLYRIELDAGVDLKRIKTGFYWSLAGQGRAVTFYLDDIRYVKDREQDTQD
ncbi:MAG: hypothetical protein ACE37H_17405 [Phycisphaeraceae bacterium]